MRIYVNRDNLLKGEPAITLEDGEKRDVSEAKIMYRGKEVARVIHDPSKQEGGIRVWIETDCEIVSK